MLRVSQSSWLARQLRQLADRRARRGTLKFRGAGQGSGALVAEIVVGELGRRLGIRVPELVIVDVDSQMARRDPDQEIQELLRASAGENLGMDFLPGSVGYDGVGWKPPPEEAARIYWLDALTANVDRTWSNPNLVIWHHQLWAIDHGAALLFQHSWPPVATWAERRYDLSQHVLADLVAALEPAVRSELDAELAETVTADVLTEITTMVPDSFLLRMNSVPQEADPNDLRRRYNEYLLARCAGPRAWWPRQEA